MKKKTSMLDPEKITIVDFHILKGGIESPFEFKIMDVEDFDVRFDFNLGFNLKEKFVKADLTVDLKTNSKEKQTKEASGHFDFAFVYHIANLEQLTAEQEDGEIQIEGDLGNALASITYSTSRGILMTRFQGTALQNFVLPVISPNKLLMTPKEI
jgi:hypothetical protein